MKKKWLLILLMTMPFDVFGQNVRFDALFYGGPLVYQSSELKKDGFSTGLYSYLGIGKYHSFEGEADYIRINYKDGTNLKQNDFTISYSNYAISKVKLQLGGHYISTTDPTTDNGWILFGSASLYKIYVWNFGVSGYFSNYENAAPALNVYQISPVIGIGSVKLNSTTYISMETRYSMIFLSHVVSESKRQYYSLEQTILFTGEKWSLRGVGWIGEQMYAIRNGGFTVYNLPERQKGGFGTSLRIVSSPKSAITFGMNYQTFQDIGTTNSAHVFFPYISIGVTI